QHRQRQLLIWSRFAAAIHSLSQRALQLGFTYHSEFFVNCSRAATMPFVPWHRGCQAGPTRKHCIEAGNADRIMSHAMYHRPAGSAIRSEFSNPDRPLLLATFAAPLSGNKGSASMLLGLFDQLRHRNIAFNALVYSYYPKMDKKLAAAIPG